MESSQPERENRAEVEEQSSSTSSSETLIRTGGTLPPGVQVKPTTKLQIELDDKSSNLPKHWYPLGTNFETKKEPIDITTDGKIVLRDKATIFDKTDETLSKIWEESKVGFEDLTKDNFKNKYIQKDNEVVDLDEEEGSDDEESTGDFTQESFEQMKVNFRGRLWEAFQEASVAEGLVNMLLANPFTNPGMSEEDLNKKYENHVPPLPLKLNAMDYSLGAKEEPTLKRKIGDCKLQIASKRNQTKSSAETLKQTNEKLKKVQSSEALFWSRMFKFKYLGWIVQSPDKHPKFGNPPYTVNYGYNDAGSRFKQLNIATLSHDLTESGGILVNTCLEHSVPKVVTLQLIEKEGTSSEDKMSDEYILPFQHPLEPLPSGWEVDLMVLKVHRKLQLARSTSLELELFHHLLREARGLDLIIKTEDDFILLRINDNINLAIRYVSVPESYINELNQNVNINISSLDRNNNICYKLKFMMLSQLRMIHQNRLLSKRNRLMEHNTYFNEPTPDEIEKCKQEIKILNTNIELCQYHFFINKIWKDTLEVLSKIELPDMEEKSEVPRIEADKIPIPGNEKANFFVSHYIVITIYGAHVIQFHTLSPNKIIAYSHSGNVDIDLGFYDQFLKSEVEKALEVFQSIPTPLNSPVHTYIVPTSLPKQNDRPINASTSV